MKYKSIFWVLCIIALTFGFSGIVYAKTPAEPAQKKHSETTLCSDANLQNTTFTLDGVTLNLCTPFLPGPLISAGSDTMQIASAVKWDKFQELSIMAVPFGTRLSTEELPPAGAGMEDQYRADLRKSRDTQGANSQSGPTAMLFGKSFVSSISVVNLNMNGVATKPILIAEWVVEAGQRLWILRASQEYDGELTALEEATTANTLFSQINMDSVTLSQPSAFLQNLKSKPAITQNPLLPSSNDITAASVADLPFPSWWNGDCDTNNYYARSGGWSAYPLGGSYRGVKACGPRPYYENAPDIAVQFYPNAPWGALEWECVELSLRYLYLAYGVAPYPGNGKDIVWNYSGSRLVKISNGTSGAAPQPGDVLSYGPATSAGHTSVVAASNVDTSGNGTVTVIEQNATSVGARTHTVSNWYVQDSQTVSGWLHEPQPVTNIVLSGTAGDNAWYKSTVNVTLAASGANQTQYKMDAGAWQIYSGIFPVSANGIHTVYYKSQNSSGNWEAEKSISFKLDATTPSGSVTIQNGSAQTYSVSVGLNAQGSDANSGLAAVHFRDAGQTVWSGWVAPGSTLWQLVGTHGQTANVEAQFKDNAGNLSAVVSDSIVLNFYPARPSSALYKLQRSTIGSVGLHATSSQYSMNGTAGQPSVVGMMQGTNYRLNSGYWALSLIPTLPPTKTNTPTATRTNTPTSTKTITPTPTITRTFTRTITSTVTKTNTPTITLTKTKTPAVTVRIFNSIGAQDGWMLESAETTNVGGSINDVATTFNLGDDAAKKQYRGMLSFSTGALPDNAVITNIKLKVQKSTIVGGGNPVTVFQGFMVDILNGIFGTAALQLTDFQAAALKSYGPFVSVPVSNWYTLDLTTAKAYINKLTTSAGLTQIRLRFKLDDDNNAVANYLGLYSGNAPIANRPQLVITYSIP